MLMALPPCPPPDRGVLPTWARTGFSDPKPKIPHVMGSRGRIVAILFGGLFSPPSDKGGNKILWVAKDPVKPLSDLKISARRLDRRGHAYGTTVHRTVTGGPGPSGIDLPHAGCWRFSLRWSGRSDSLDLRYRKPS
jgi:hypothetical protein